MMMKTTLKITLTVLILSLLALTAQAKTAKFGHKGCDVEMNAVKRGAQHYLVVSIKSRERTFISDPELLIKTFDGAKMALKGVIINTGQQSGSGVVVSGMVLHSNYNISVAQFEISDEQINMLQNGVQKIRLMTTPALPDKEFDNDKVGKKLYDLFQQAVDVEADF